MEPKLIRRKAQPYVAIRTSETMSSMATVMPRHIPELLRWLDSQGLKPVGPEFIRFVTIDMERALELEVGFPVAKPIKGSGRVQPGTLPAGRYASLAFQGNYKDLAGANEALQAWGKRQGLEWDTTPSPQGPKWGGRFEFYFTNPDDEPNPALWKSEVLYRIKDAKPK
ncbi:MAG: GyrI-like domain-containing protein [Fimbriimonas sp.]